MTIAWMDMKNETNGNCSYVNDWIERTGKGSRVMFVRITVHPSFHGSTATSGPGPPHCRDYTITLRHTTLDRTPLGE